jgi:hypothetical protein
MHLTHSLFTAAAAAVAAPCLPPAAFAPPTVADTKGKFTKSYTRPIPAIYNNVIQELLVQQHFIRYSINYKYNAVSVSTGLTVVA